MNNKPAQIMQSQHGASLLEAMIAVVIFSIGVLGMVAMQAATIKNIGAGQYRFEANMLAEDLVGIVLTQTAGGKSVADMHCGSPCLSSANYQIGQWLQKVNAQLPGASAVPPSIILTSDSTYGRQLVVTIRWRVPNANGGGFTTHQHALRVAVNDRHRT